MFKKKKKNLVSAIPGEVQGVMAGPKKATTLSGQFSQGSDIEAESCNINWSQLGNRRKEWSKQGELYMKRPRNALTSYFGETE